MSILQKLTEGIVNRDMKKEGAALLNKWGKTGLLEGLESEGAKQTMSRLLENQAKELLREASTMGAGGDVEGFAAVAFPIVRRVFGGLIANDLVSVQPMSLPSGLIFFMDFQFTDDRLNVTAADSLYGGGVVGQQITGGVDLTGVNEEKSFYSLNNGYSSPTGSKSTTMTLLGSEASFPGEGQIGELCRFDPGITSGSAVVVGKTTTSTLTQFNKDDLVAIDWNLTAGSGSGADHTGNVLRRLTQYSGSAKTHILVVLAASGSETVAQLSKNLTGSTHTTTFPENDNFDGTPAAGTTNAIGAVVGADNWGLEADVGIPEIDIKVDSVSVTAMTKKLKAKWSPELGQDLNAYHNLDAEVELTSILSEQIALEIDREILEDLIKGATAGTYYWSRSPGMFLHRTTGAEIGASAVAPDFTGTVSEWYETLLETVNDVSAAIHRKTLRGGANFLVTSPEVASILEFTSGFRASVAVDENKGTAGASKVGSVSKKWDIYVDPYFPRNLLLIGRKGNSFLESGYVYAPYVPLQVTPTIFGTEDFVPRKGVMTRYAKKMVRPDMYGLVVVRGLLGESGT
jgi:hypothetical protein